VALRDAVRTLETIKVSTSSTTRGVAAALAHLVRENRSVEILAGSGRTLATAIKACAVARKLLKDDDRDVAVAARLTSTGNADESTASRRTRLYLVPLASIVESGTPSEACASYTVKSNTNPAALAGALTARLREGKTAVVSCIGVDAVTRAATALALASQYRTADVDEAKDDTSAGECAHDTIHRVVAVCHFTTETSGAPGRAGEEVNVLNLHVRTV
jgi:stage V sporulation protein SpoVS